MTAVAIFVGCMLIAFFVCGICGLRLIVSQEVSRKDALNKFNDFLLEIKEVDNKPISAIVQFHWDKNGMGQPLLMFDRATIFFKSGTFICSDCDALREIQGICYSLNPQFQAAPDPRYVNMRRFRNDPKQSLEQSLNSPHIVIST